LDFIQASPGRCSLSLSRSPVRYLISGRYVWLGPGMLSIFKGLANLLVNRVWEMTGDERFVAINGFFEHIDLIAGYILAALAAEQEYGRRQAG